MGPPDAQEETGPQKEELVNTHRKRLAAGTVRSSLQSAQRGHVWCSTLFWGTPGRKETWPELGSETELSGDWTEMVALWPLRDQSDTTDLLSGGFSGGCI